MTSNRKIPRAALPGILALSAALSSPVYAGAVPDQALQYATDGYFRKALAIIEPLVKEHPRDAEVQFRYGQALTGIGKGDDAITALKTAISIDPGNGVYHRALGEAYGLNAQKGGVFGMFGLMKSARAEFQSAVQLAPQDVQSHIFLAMFYLMVPSIAGGSIDKAHAEEELIDKLDAVQGLQIRATEAGQKDDTAAGEALLKQAVAKDKTAGSLMALGLFYTQAKRYDDAFKAFRDAQAKDPKAYAAGYQIGRVAGFAKSNYEEGIAALKRYQTFDDLPDTVPSLAWAHFRLGNLYEYQGHADEARAEYKLASAMNKGDERLTNELKRAAL